MTGSPSHHVRKHRRHHAGLVMISLYKLLGALVFVAIGVGALRLVGKDVVDVFSRIASDLRFNPESRFVNFVLDRVSLLDDPMLQRIGIAAFGYAAVGILESIGLYLEKAWGEWLTLIITASFLPLEIHELHHRFTWVRISLFIANLLVLVYLIWILGARAAQRRRERTT